MELPSRVSAAPQQVQVTVTVSVMPSSSALYIPRRPKPPYFPRALRVFYQVFCAPLACDFECPFFGIGKKVDVKSTLLAAAYDLFPLP